MSRFVTAGSNDDYHAPEADEWTKAEEQIKANSKPKPEVGTQEGGRSLYEVLQANKAAKQDAFDEKTKLSNQFRNLDEDEVDFLDSVLDSTRAQEASIRKETDEQIASFRKQREQAEKAAREQGAQSQDPGDAELWTAPRKRKRRDDQSSQLKVRKASSGNARSGPEVTALAAPPLKRETGASRSESIPDDQEKSAKKETTNPLVDYGTDSDD